MLVSFAYWASITLIVVLCILHEFINYYQQMHYIAIKITQITDCYFCNFNRNIVHLLVIINKLINRLRVFENWVLRREFVPKRGVEKTT